MESIPLRQVRAATERLCAPLSVEDCAPQSMPEASPVKWHLAHTTWFFETFILQAAIPGYRAYEPRYRSLFNSYYETLGGAPARAARGLLTRPTLEEVRRYRAHVDRHLDAVVDDPGWAALLWLGLHHEQQHQELILTDVKHLFAQNPLRPAYATPDPGTRTGTTTGTGTRTGTATWHTFDGGIVSIGADDRAFAFDCERPRHGALLAPFALARRAVSVAEYREFMRDGGYRRPELWLSDGIAWVRAHAIAAPLYWDDDDTLFTLAGPRALVPDEPVCHLSYYEADAFARWAGARLPTELEWEHAAAGAPVDGNFVESGALHPRGGAALFGDVWQWTRSAYAPYPGYRPLAGSVGEYNGKFMCNQLVLRGGSCLSPRSHLRASYRNYFPPSTRWQMSGIRLAKDAA